MRCPYARQKTDAEQGAQEVEGKRTALLPDFARLASNSKVVDLARKAVASSNSHVLTNAVATAQVIREQALQVQASRNEPTPRYFTCNSAVVEEYDSAEADALRFRILKHVEEPFVQSAVTAGLPTTSLNQASFKNGTYRIKTAGIYKLTSNVVFGANALATQTRGDLPVSGDWFAGISVECDGPVTLLGQGYKFSQSAADAAAQPTGAFALIVLGNALFAGALFGFGNANYPETVATGYRGASNIAISGFRFGTSNHFAIRGSLNDNVRITACTFTDHQIGSINLQSATNLCIDLCLFNGSTSVVRTLIASSIATTSKQFLSTFAGMGVAGASAHLTALNSYVNSNAARFKATQSQTPANYAMILSAGSSAAFTFPINSTENAVGMAISNGHTATDIQVTNCLFSGFSCKPLEQVTIGTNIPTDPAGIPLSTIPLFGPAGSLEWKDAFNSAGNFSPNAYLKAVAFVASVIYSGFDAGTLSLVPANVMTILNSILTSNAAQFFANAAPIVGRGSDLTQMKGLFGVRLIGCTNVLLEGLIMDSFDNPGVLSVPTTIPGYAQVQSPQPISRFRGNDNWFYSFEACNGIKMKNCTMSRMKTGRGFSFAIDMPQDDSNIDITNVAVINVSSPNTVDTPAVRPGDTFGISVRNELGPISITNALTVGLTAASDVFPFPVASATVTLNNTRNI